MMTPQKNQIRPFTSNKVRVPDGRCQRRQQLTKERVSAQQLAKFVTGVFDRGRIKEKKILSQNMDNK